jgi:selenocysteine-specific elongation factor
LDLDIHSNTCRLAFEGRIIHHFEDKSYRTSELPKLKIYKFKEKTGQVSFRNSLDGLYLCLEK